MLFQKVHVNERERAILSRSGRFRSILLPGMYRFLAVPKIQVEFHRVSSMVFESKWADTLPESHPKIVAVHFTAIETNDAEVAMIYLNGELRRMLLPSSRVLLWKGAGAPSVERINIIDQPEPSTSLESLGDRLVSANCEDDLDWSVDIPQEW